jgi:protoporphyrin/coproporphyrin ferrochelatase
MSPTAPPPTGVLVMAHGTPASPAGIQSFYIAIRHGRPPPPELLDQLVRRYQAIGGTSPLTERTRAQIGGLSSALEAVAPGRFVVGYGAKYASPTIEEGMATLVGAGVDRVVGLVLTPHQSSLGSDEYLRRARQASESAPHPLAFTAVPSWHRAPGLAELLADRVRVVLAALDDDDARQVAVFFTAHSLPQRVVAEGDPYPDQVGESASDIAGLAGLDDMAAVSWGVAWQSAGRTDEPWIGPDLLGEMARVIDAGATSVVVCPVGFVSDHLEILYDLDIEAAAMASSLGVAFARTPSLNDDPLFTALLAQVVCRAAVPATEGDVPAVIGPIHPA